MAINPDLLIAAPMLQDYFVDKTTGFPLANGLVRLYKDTSRSFYKNWYYQTGVPGAYTYIPLNNPMNLSSVGTIQDPNGNDVIPFFYPFDETNENEIETYYITVDSVDSNGHVATRQFTRENFPFMGANNTPTSQNPTLRNYIINNVYWRNFGPLDAMSVTDQVIAPSQHDGYTNGDIRFRKNITGADDDLAFLPMGTAILPNNAITPEYYLNVNCTALQLGETLKCIQYPVSLHVDTLANVSGNFVFYAQNVAGNVNNTLTISVYQFAGTGSTTQPDPIVQQTFTINENWQRYVCPITFPDTVDLVLGGGGDDALFIQIGFPLSTTFDINHTKPQLYLSDSIPDNDFDTYDQIESIINSPRTGDTKFTMNGFGPFGYVPGNNGTIGSASSNATTRKNIDTWPLFNLFWSLSSTYITIYTSAGAITTRGATAIADFTANKAISLPNTLNNVLAGTSTQNVTAPSQGYTTSVASGTILTVTNASNFTKGTSVALSGGSPPTGLTNGVIYYAIPITATTMQLAATLSDAVAGNPVIFTNMSGSGTIQNVSRPLAGYAGEEAHSLTGSENGAHSHGGAGTTGNFIMSSTIGGVFAAGTVGTVSPTTANSGSGAPHNTIQPTTYMNVYYKL